MTNTWTFLDRRLKEGCYEQTVKNDERSCPQYFKRAEIRPLSEACKVMIFELHCMVRSSRTSEVSLGCTYLTLFA
jgi:hypothetical protein